MADLNTATPPTSHGFPIEKKRRQVALLIETSNAYARGLLRGIHRYQREHQTWNIFLQEQSRGEVPPITLSQWHGDGIIARIENAEIARAVTQCGLPVIDVSAARLNADAPVVETNNEEISRLAFEHLFERGFKNFAFCGDDRFAWSQSRRDWFARFAKAAGCEVSVYPAASNSDDSTWDGIQAGMGTWVQQLPKPVGVMACYDNRAWQLLEICRSLDVAVPEDVAIIGVDNDELLCQLTHPPLSSVIPDSDRAGYEAAALLDRCMNGELVAPTEYLIKPRGLATRQSTDTLAINDVDVSRAVRFIRAHACDGIKVDDVLQHVHISRRVLEYRFKALLGRTPHDEIARVRVQRVIELITETDLPLATIADRAGFVHVEYMGVAFKRQTGLSPSDFRRKHCKDVKRSP